MHSGNMNPLPNIAIPVQSYADANLASSTTPSASPSGSSTPLAFTPLSQSSLANQLNRFDQAFGFTKGSHYNGLTVVATHRKNSLVEKFHAAVPDINIESLIIKENGPEARRTLASQLVQCIKQSARSLHFINLVTEANLGYSGIDIDTREALKSFLNAVILADNRRFICLDLSNQDKLDFYLNAKHQDGLTPQFVVIKLFYRGAGGCPRLDQDAEDQNLPPFIREVCLASSFYGLAEINILKSLLLKKNGGRPLRSKTCSNRTPSASPSPTVQSSSPQAASKVQISDSEGSLAFSPLRSPLFSPLTNPFANYPLQSPDNSAAAAATEARLPAYDIAFEALSGSLPASFNVLSSTSLAVLSEGSEAAEQSLSPHTPINLTPKQNSLISGHHSLFRKKPKLEVIIRDDADCMRIHHLDTDSETHDEETPSQCVTFHN